jgi:hypothetical protein
MSKPSVVWQHFTSKTTETSKERTATCNACKKAYKFSGSTSTLLRHLMDTHPKLLEKEKETVQTLEMMLCVNLSNSLTYVRKIGSVCTEEERFGHGSCSVATRIRTTFQPC